MDKALPAIPAKRYFTIGEVSELCGVKPYVLRYWEQEFTQLKPMKRRGNRRYYQHHEVLLIRRIRDLLYDQGFTISGARNQLADGAARGEPQSSFRDEAEAAQRLDEDLLLAGQHLTPRAAAPAVMAAGVQDSARTTVSLEKLSIAQVREELLSIRSTLLAQ
ncbi:MerR family transcriptional regulator [Paucibacter sp. APW11]|uniref:MerR family transcriptional regulator n=1 Tax=Roseateles aquae TaxID=3077235 RepID=A0ABU3P8E9_9BURK|nr:MerR family transcriptional regulator [Paucibacter sp. APW11]MDT8998572.1 MerR family transcriptional regulator [Paucibacter sp. APW11]